MLGPVEVRRDGAELAVRGMRQRALLAVLLVRRAEVVASDRLIDELWHQQPPETASTSLHGLVSQLRKTLEPDRAAGSSGAVLVTRAPGYALVVDPQSLDAARFEQLLTEGRAALTAGDAGRASRTLRSALALWRGPAYADVTDVPSVHAEATRLDELRVEALEDRIDADLALGHDRELVPELEALVEREPLRERPRSQLMLALYRSGRQAEALALYRETRSRFVEELGIEPSPRLRELEQAMLAQDPELDAGLPRLRPPAVLRRRPRRRLLAVAATIVAVAGSLGAIAILSTGGATVSPQPGSLAVVDPASARVVDTIEVGSGPVAVVAGHGSIWVANSEDDTVSRIDLGTYDVEDTIGVPSPVDLAVAPDAIWVASGLDGTVSRIDPESNDVVATVDLRSGDRYAPRTVNGVAADPRGVWVAVTDSRMIHVDAESNSVDRKIAVGDQLAVAVGHGALWVVTPALTLLRVEPRTGAITAKLGLGVGFPTAVVAGDDGVLVPSGDVWVVSPDSTRLVGTLSVGIPVSAVADAPGPGLWVATVDGTVALLAPGPGEPPTRVEVGGRPQALTVADGKVWVTIGDDEL